MPTVRLRWGIFALPLFTAASTLVDEVDSYSEMTVDALVERGPVTLGVSEVYVVPFLAIVHLRFAVMRADTAMMVQLTSPQGVAAFPVQEELVLVTETSPPTALSITGPGTFSYVLGGMVT